MPPRSKPAHPLERRQWVSRLQKPVGQHCDGCVLQAIGSGFVQPRGPASRILLLGEAPGPEELKGGIPFIGPAGSMLERLFRFLGKDLSQYRIDNTIRCLPPGMEMTGPAAASYAPLAIERCKYRHESISLPEVQVIVT